MHFGHLPPLDVLCVGYSWLRPPLFPEPLGCVDQGFRVAIPVREDKLGLGIVGLRGGHWSFSISGSNDSKNLISASQSARSGSKR